MPSAAGATNERKSEGVIQDGTARTPRVTLSHSELVGEEVFSEDVDGGASFAFSWGGSR